MMIALESSQSHDQIGELVFAEQLDKVIPQYHYKCAICKCDTPCVHQLDLMRLEGYSEGFREGINDRVEMYGALLHDGDFERYQPNTTIEPKSIHNPDYVLELLEATVEEYRYLWIRNRLTLYLSDEWQTYNVKTMECFERCIMLAKIAHEQGSTHKSIPYLLQL